LKAPAVPSVPSDEEISAHITNWGADEVTISHDGDCVMVISFHRHDHRCGRIYKSICKYLLKHFSDDWDVSVLGSPKLNEMCYQAYIHARGDKYFSKVPTFVTAAHLGLA